MAEVSYFWTTNGTGDGTSGGYTAANFSQYLEDVTITNSASEGVLFGVDNNLAASVGVGDRVVSINTGAAIVNGKYYKNSATPVTLELDPTGSNRTDRIVLRANFQTTQQIVRLAVSKGADGSATPPALAQSEGGTWEIPIANVAVNSSNVLTITDARVFVKTPAAYGWFSTPLTLNSTLNVSGNITTTSDLIVSGGDIRIGADVDIRRSAANVLTIDDAVSIAGNLQVTGTVLTTGAVTMSGGFNAPSGTVTSGTISNATMTTASITTATITSGTITNARITNLLSAGVIGESNIAAGAVTNAKLGALAVDAAKIAGGAVTSAKLAAGAVVTTSITDNVVTNAKLAANAVVTTSITDGAVTNAKLGALSVDAAKLASNAVETAKINASAVTSAKIANGAVETAKIADGAVTSAKIAADAVTSVGLAASAVVTTSIANNAVTSAKLAANAVVTTSITDSVVTAAKLASNSVETAKIASNAVTSGKVGGAVSIFGSRIGSTNASWKLPGTSTFGMGNARGFVSAGASTIVCSAGQTSGSLTPSFGGAPGFARDPIVIAQVYGTTVVDPWFLQVTNITAGGFTIYARNMLGNTGQSVVVHWVAFGEAS